MENSAVIERGLIPAAESRPGPSPRARVLLAVLLLIMLLPFQLVVALPVLTIGLMLQEGSGLLALNEAQIARAMEGYMFSETGLALTLVATGLSGLLTVAVALGWPLAWRVITRRDVSFADWYAWLPVGRFPLWLVPLLTLPVLALTGVLAQVVGEPEIAIQEMIFSTPLLQVISIVVVLLAAVTEELVFRGALYTALLAARPVARPGWRRHILPFVVTATLFALVHLLAGFETPSAILQIFLLSAFLTWLRATTGSVKASMAAHVFWNALAALALILYNLLQPLAF